MPKTDLQKTNKQIYFHITNIRSRLASERNRSVSSSPNCPATTAAAAACLLLGASGIHSRRLDVAAIPAAGRGGSSPRRPGTPSTSSASTAASSAGRTRHRGPPAPAPSSLPALRVPDPIPPLCKNLPSSASCLSATMGMNTCVQCCSLAERLADV
jgi:hypothetical protein